jgi:large subunit ribosomal protein L10
VLRKDKERLVAELAERLRTSETLIVADYRGLSMTEIDDVRTKLLAHGARFSVVKNTLTKRAAEQAGVDALAELLDGPTAIAFVGTGDMVGVAKTLSAKARETRVLTIKGGILQGEPLSAEQVRELASLPAQDVLQGQVVAAIVGPVNAVVGLFTAPLRELVGVLDARINQLQEEDVGAGQPAAEDVEAVGAGHARPDEAQEQEEEQTDGN